MKPLTTSDASSRPIRKFLIVLLYAALVTTALGDPTRATAKTAAPEPLYEDARTRFAQNDYAGAIVQLKSALQQNPDYLPARLLLGQAYLATKDSQAAIKELTIAKRAGADDAFTLIPLARAYAQLGEHGRILAEIRNGNRDPDLEADILLERGKAYMALNKLDKAQRAFAEVSRFRPDSADAYIEYARLQLKRQDGDAAEELVGAAMIRAPEDAEVWYVSGDLRRFNRDFEGAITDFAKALQFDPQHEAARMARAGTLIDAGRHAEAEPDVIRLRELNPANPRPIYFHVLILAQTGRDKEANIALGEASSLLEAIDPKLLIKQPPALLLAGMVAYLRKDFESAGKHLARYVELSPKHLSSRRILASLLLRRGDNDKAVKILRQAQALAPKDVRIMAMLGNALMRKRQYAEAAELFERAAALAPKNAKIQLNLGLNRLNVGQDDRAADALKNALSLDADETSAAVMLSFAQLRNGQFEAALESARALSKREPKNAFAQNVMGGAQMALGRLPEAHASFERALAIDPGYQSARFNLARLELTRGDLAAGEAQYLEILKSNDENLRAMAGLARIARARGETDSAIRWLEKVRAIDPKSVDEQIALAKLYDQANDFNASMQVLRTLVRNAPRNLAALEALARVEIRANSRDAATKSLNRLVSRAETTRSAEWLVRAARHFLNLEDYKAAGDTLKSAIKLKPKDLAIQTAMFEFEVRLGKFKDAARRAKDLRLDFPRSPIGLTLLGDLAMRQSQPLEAADFYKSGFREFRTPGLLVRLYRANKSAGRTRQMIEPLEAWIAKHPEDIVVRRVYAAALMEVGRNAESLTLHQALLEKQPNDPALLNNVALLFHVAGDARALPYAERAYKGAQRSAATLDTYGWLLVQNDQLEKGLEMLRNAQARAPKVAEINYHIAVALHKLGRNDEAKRQLEAVLSSDERFKGHAGAQALLDKLSGG